MIYIFAKSMGLHLSGKYKDEFAIPYESMDEMFLWQEWSETFRAYRVVVAIQWVIVSLNLLADAAIHLPSLGLIFDTLYVSRWDCASFTIILSFFLLMITGCTYVIYGAEAEMWSSFG